MKVLPFLSFIARELNILVYKYAGRHLNRLGTGFPPRYWKYAEEMRMHLS